MIRTLRIGALAACLALASLASQPAEAAHHEPVIQAYIIDVQPGKLDAYRGEVAKLRGVMERLGAPSTVRMWRSTAAGTQTGGVLIGVEYPNAAAWAESQPKIEADAEYQKILAGLSAMRTVVSHAVWRDISPNASTQGPGAVLVVTGVQVKPGKLEEYRKRVGKFQGISERLGLTGRVRMWRAELAGPNTGGVAVGVEYADLATYVAEQAKLAGDAEWNQILAGLDEIRTLVSRSMFQDITP